MPAKKIRSKKTPEELTAEHRNMLGRNPHIMDRIVGVDNTKNKTDEIIIPPKTRSTSIPAAGDVVSKRKDEQFQNKFKRDSKILLNKALDKTNAEIGKEINLTGQRVGKIANKPENKETTMELKAKLRDGYLAIADEAIDILKEDNFRRLKAEGAYKVAIVGKMMGEAARDMEKVDLGKTNIQNLAIFMQEATLQFGNLKEDERQRLADSVQITK